MTAPSWHEHSRGIVLESASWRLNYDLHLGLFDLSAPAHPAFGVRWARARACYCSNRRRHSVGSDDGRTESWRVEPTEDVRGAGLRLVVVSRSARRPALHFTATLYRESPLLVLELTLLNTLPHPIRVESLQPLEIDPQWGGRISLGSPIAGIYRAGWQSWSPAGWKPAQARDRATRVGALFGPMHDSGGPAHPGHFRADLVGVLTPGDTNPVLLAGLLSTADQFGALETRLDGARPALALTCVTDGLPLAPSEGLSSERAVLLLARPEERPLEVYGAALGQEMEGRPVSVAPQGWCSWPAFGPHLREQEVLRQIEWLSRHRPELPISVVQIDDGWERIVGDWEANERFPHGMKWLAEQIRRAGFTPGLWLAPLIAAPRSGLARDHPEWLLRDTHGRPVHGGFGSVGFCRGLDITVPAVHEWLYHLITTVVHEWGYPYLKLDFLYGAALPARRHRANTTRAQALRRALETIRQAAGPDTFLLGCGCPLGPAIGLVDAMRVGADVAPDWHPRYGLATPIIRGDPSFPATANTVRNTLTRAWTHRRLWLNDPDPLLLRRSGSRLSLAEVQSLATAVALGGGPCLLGDDLPSLDADRRPLATACLPPHTGQPWTPDALREEWPSRLIVETSGPWGRGWVVALFNWQNRPADLLLDLAAIGAVADRPHHLHEFWSGEYRRVQGEARLPRVEAHGCRAFLLQAVEEKPQWVGSSLHIVQGQEVREWAADPRHATMVLDAGRGLDGSVLLWWPGAGLLHPARLHNVEQAEVEPAAEGLWRLRVHTAGPGPSRIVLTSED